MLWFEVGAAAAVDVVPIRRVLPICAATCDNTSDNGGLVVALLCLALFGIPPSELLAGSSCGVFEEAFALITLPAAVAAG